MICLLFIYLFFSMLERTEECSSNSRGGCEQYCENVNNQTSNLKGYYCTCLAGFSAVPTNKKKCEDVDECATNMHRCSQICTNYNGTYRCSCYEGFTLSDTLTGVCKSNDPEMSLLFSNG